MAQSRFGLATAALVLSHRLCAASNPPPKMICGDDVPLCGTLTLQTGLGDGVYKSDHASVHGLWPQVGHYGTSECIKPSGSDADLHKLYKCYAQGDSKSHQLQFEKHEWMKHGKCAGIKDVDDFFDQVCTLSKHPVEILEKAKEAGKSFDEMAQALRDHGYPVWNLFTQGQIELSACAGDDGRWLLVPVSDFSSKCRGSRPAPAPAPNDGHHGSHGGHHGRHGGHHGPHGGHCVRGQHGPSCSEDSDCKGLSGCLRCAKSGYCAAEPLPSFTVQV